MTRRFLLLLVCTVLPVVAPLAQEHVSLFRIGAEHDASLRRAALTGDSTASAGYLMRSASSRTVFPAAREGRVVIRAIAPDVQLTSNSQLPFSLNDGAMWAGRGTTGQITGGAALRWQRLRVLVAPTVWRASNGDFALPTDPDIAPPIPSPRSPWGSPHHWYSRSIDTPRRFGDQTLLAVDLGQTGAWLEWDRVAVGLSNEQQWWGPGLNAALLLSNNAAGFGHAFVRTRRPLDTRLGQVEAQYLLGNLTASKFFEVGPATNPARSISAAAATIVPRGVSGLTLGISRMVVASTDERADVLGRAFDVLRSVPSPNARPYGDPTQIRGRDQLLSLFGRWVFAEDGGEVWAEWGRADQFQTLREVLTMPGHSQAYTIGAQISRPITERWSVGAQFEHTKTQQSGSFRERPTGSWYTSRAVLQGFTQRGQVLGAAAGPGANTQFVAVDLRDRRRSVGAFVGRIRWDDDAMYTIPRPVGNGLCKHDVTLYLGGRLSHRTERFELGTSASTQHRLNAFYGSTGFCFIEEQRADRRNVTVQFSIGPRFR